MPSVTPDLANTNLFKPIKVGKVELKNRLVHAPTTRLRNTDDFIPTNIMKDYYEARAENNGGLLIAEGASVSLQGGGFPNIPMFATEQQAKAWKVIVDAVHAKDTVFAAQIEHIGRAAVPGILKQHGLPLLGPSALYIDENSEKAAKEAGNEIQVFTLEQIEELKKEFVHAAKNAIEVSGFDFVEIHAASMFTLAQFIDIVSNKRTDKYGGSIENRSRLVLEIVDLLIETVGADKVGIRLSPYTNFQGGSGADSKLMHPIAQYAYLYSELEKKGREGKRLAYIHSVEPRVGNPTPGNGDFSIGPEYSSEWISQIWKGVLIRSGGYLHQPDYPNLINDVNADDRTLISVSRYYTSNPDLASRLKEGKELTWYNRSLFYVPGTNNGYNTWTKYGEEDYTEDSEVSKKVPVALA